MSKAVGMLGFSRSLVCDPFGDTYDLHAFPSTLPELIKSNHVSTLHFLHGGDVWYPGNEG